MWQEIVVGACVLAALVFVVRRYLIKGKAGAGSGSCGGCSGCNPQGKACPK